MSRHHPYQGLPNHAFWRRAIGSLPKAEVDPVVAAPFRITPADGIATAGSCFAQHIARYLRTHGFNFLITEDAHPMAPPALANAYAYGQFTARYGNIYTSRQLLQLIQRAYGALVPADDVWQEEDGRLIDPFRPTVQPDGFKTRAEYEADRSRHLACVRQAFEELDVFVFTLGLTECWASRVDGVVYPLCPGVAGGVFNGDEHVFLNLTVDDTVGDMLAFWDRLKTVNPAARMILTVSPVPLIATYEPRHVLVATTLSKSVLRVACEILSQAEDEVTYFPSYEIITGSFARGSYYAEDCRSVTEEGVAHVMRLFLRHFTGHGEDIGEVDAALVARSSRERQQHAEHTRQMEHLVEVNCDEEYLDRTP